MGEMSKEEIEQTRRFDAKKISCLRRWMWCPQPLRFAKHGSLGMFCGKVVSDLNKGDGNLRELK